MLKPLQFFIFIALGGSSQSLPKNVPYDVNRLTLLRRHFWAYFLKMLFCIIVFSILAISKHIDMWVKILRETWKYLYLHKIYWETSKGRVKSVPRWCPHIMMFYGCPKKVNLTHSAKFITKILLQYSFRVPPENKNIRAHPMSHKFRRDDPRTS